MRKVTVNWTDLEIAFERNSPDIESYLDLTTGEVVSIVAGEADAHDKRARVIANGHNFARVDPASSREQYRWMEKFVTAVPDEALRERLVIAIDGKGAFRRFKDVLLNYPAERERWFTYRGELLHFHMQGWLDQMEIEADNPPPWGHVEQPAEPESVVEAPLPHAEAPGEILRRQAKEVIDAIPAVELPSAIAFLEFLRDRGSSSLLGNGKRAKKAAPVPAAQVAAARAKAIAGARETLAATPNPPNEAEADLD
jgi:uncharacterized protein UPF0158